DEARGPQERADREGAMAEVECAGTDLEEQRRHHEKIVPAHENDLDILPAFAKPLQMTGRVNSSEAAAQDHDSGLSHRSSPRPWNRRPAGHKPPLFRLRPAVARFRQGTDVHCVAVTRTGFLPGSSSARLGSLLLQADRRQAAR